MADGCAAVSLPAACPLWKKVKQSGSVPHLSRWFDFMSSLPSCSGAINSLCYKQKVAAAQEADRAAGKGGGGKQLLRNVATATCCAAGASTLGLVSSGGQALL